MNATNAKDYLSLVQALADGKAIEGYFEIDEKWRELVEVRFDAPADQYRIKPEPREVWIRRHKGGGNGSYSYNSEVGANTDIDPEWTAIRYREVIE